MNKTKPSNPQVFPTTDKVLLTEHGVTQTMQGGMTLRDYFAGQALSTALAVKHPSITQDNAAEMVSKIAYAIADAMLKARGEG